MRESVSASSDLAQSLGGRITVGNKAHTAFFEALSVVSLPKLRNLDLRIVGLRPPTLTAFLRNAPALETLRIAGMDTFTGVPVALLAPLVELRTITLSASVDFLSTLPKLAQIWLPVPFPVPLPLSAYLSFRSLLSHFEFSPLDSSEAVWSALTCTSCLLTHTHPTLTQHTHTRNTWHALMLMRNPQRT